MSQSEKESEQELKAVLERNKALVKTLTLLLEKLNIKGIADKNKLIATVAKNILKVHGDVSRKHLLDPQFQKALCAALMGQALNDKNPSFKFDYKKLFDKNLSYNDLKKELTLFLEVLLLERNKLSNTKKLTQAEISKIANDMADKSIKNYLKKDSEPSTHASKLTEVLVEGLRNLYGIDPRFAGSQPTPVYTETGNLAGIAVQTVAREQSGQPIDTFNLYENLIRLDKMLDGVTAQIMRVLENDPLPEPNPDTHKLPNPFDTTLERKK